jgi:hypothetical protein
MTDSCSFEQPMANLQEQLVVNWSKFARQDELDELLLEALTRAAKTDVQLITVTSPASRLLRLRLAPVTERASLDTLYNGESAELSVSDDGRCFLVYRRNDGGDYAVQWSTATLVPEALLREIPDVLASAMFDGPA